LIFHGNLPCYEIEESPLIAEDFPESLLLVVIGSVLTILRFYS